MKNPKLYALLLSATSLCAATVSGPATCQQGQACTYAASGGTSPYTYSLVSGSVGSIDSTTGVYVAPGKVAPKQVLGGCQVLPNNSIYNTRIDNLPVHSSSPIWMSNMNYGIVSTGSGMRVNTVLSTDATTTMSFYYTTAANGPFIFKAFPDRLSEGGAALTAPGWLPGMDNHYLTVYRDTCKLQEVYQLYTPSIIVGETPGVNSQSGVITNLEDNAIPGYGTDAAGLLLVPLITHQDEFLAAANGNLDAIQHALRITMDGQSINAAVAVWPAPPGGSGGLCQGDPAPGAGNTWTITGNGTTTVTQTSPHDFRAWPAGMPVTIDGTNYTVVSTSNPDPALTSNGYSFATAGYVLTMVVSTPVPSGTHTMTTPGANCARYGDRLRLKANFVAAIPSSCNVGCQNVANAIIRAEQRYGVLISDLGGVGNSQADGDYGSPDIAAGLSVVQCYTAGCTLMGASNYEIVDESTLQTNRTQTSTDNNWLETKLGNSYVTPDGAAVIKVTDSAAVISYYSVSLQGVAVGVEHPNEMVMAGASPFKLAAWVTGADARNTYLTSLVPPVPLYTCTMQPSGGPYGTITPGCLYTPPPVSAVPAGKVTSAVVTIMATADSSARKTVTMQVIPVAADGKMYLSLGKAGFDNYNDGTRTWISDKPAGLSPSLTPDSAIYSKSGWSDSTGTYVASSPGIFSAFLKGENDVHLRVHVPNGSVTGTVVLGNPGTAINMIGFSFDCNGVAVVPQTDLFTFIPVALGVAPVSCTETVSDGMLHMVVRKQGVNFGPNGTYCTANCYLQETSGYSTAVNALVITPPSTPTVETSHKAIICPTICTEITYVQYPLNPGGLYHAMNDAATYQDTVGCIPYFIEGPGGMSMQMSGVPFPFKTCAQYVEIRSSGGWHFTPGQRYNPSTDDAFAFGLQGSKVLGNGSTFGTNGGTRYWRFRNVNFFTDDSDGTPLNVTAGTWQALPPTWVSGGHTYSLGELYLDSNGLVEKVFVAGVGGTSAPAWDPRSGFGTTDGTVTWLNIGLPGPYVKLSLSGTLPSRSSDHGVGQIAINNISPATYNIGNTANSIGEPISAGANAVYYKMATNPGSYASSGTVTPLYLYGLSAFIAWGTGFDPNIMPDHLEVIQGAFRGDGDGDVTHGITISGDNVRVLDSYFAGLQDAGTDAGPIIMEYGNEAEFRNNTINGGSENFGIGGSLVSAGTLPSFVRMIGNSLAKEVWQGIMGGSSDPGTLPCFQGRTYHNSTTNKDWICGASSGTWTVQANLLSKVQLAPKNLWECKLCRDVRMVGNDFGMIAGQNTQAAQGIVLNLVTQVSATNCNDDGRPWPCVNVDQPWTTIADFNIEANRFHDGYGPLAIAYAIPGPCKSINKLTGVRYTDPCYNYGHHNISFQQNLITNVADERGYCPAFGSGLGGYCIMSVDRSESQTNIQGPASFESADYDIDVSHNTMTTSKFSINSGLVQGFGSNLAGTTDYSGTIHVRNNIGPMGLQGFQGGADWDLTALPQDGCGMQAMFKMYGGVADLHNNILTDDPASGHTWQTFATGSVTPACATAASTSAIWPTDHAGGMSWTSILNTSTFKVNTGGTSCNGGSCSGFATDGRDPGSDVDYVTWKTAHAVDGVFNPKLDWAIRSIVATSSTGATIYFTAPSTAACTWELSTNPGSYSSPVAVTSQARNGRDGTATWTASLSASTVYWVRATCGGDKLETVVNGARAMVVTGP